MTSTREYLVRHYLDLPAYAAAANCSPGRVQALIASAVIPAPTYRVREDDVLVSPVFGELPAHGAPAGAYFHAGNVFWLQQALQWAEVMDDVALAVHLRARFVADFAAALAALNTTLLRLPDCFAENGEVIAAGLKARCDAAWSHHLAGIFGLCVMRPDSIPAIAQKELLQEKLGVLTDNGQRRDYPAAMRAPLRDGIRAYADLSMPFSPEEYPRSSRKRLVEDVQAALSASGG